MRLRQYRGRHLRPKPKKHGPIVAMAAASVSIASPAYAGVHVVNPGDTVSGVAARYGVSVGAIVQANGLADADLIVTGSRLRIPRKVVTRSHRVVAGETLSSIAARYGTSVERLARSNDLADPNLIVVGQVLRVRGAGSAPAPAAASGGGVEASLERHAAAQGVEVDLVKAVAWQESGWRQEARSSVGAIGVMQVMPDTADYVNEVLGGGDLDVRRTDDNVQLGVRYLRHVRDLMGSTRKGLAAYYSGPGNVKSRLAGYQKTYVNSVQALRQRFK